MVFHALPARRLVHSTTVAAFLIFCRTSPTLALQSRSDLYNCEGCEAIYEHSFEDLDWKVTIPPANEPGQHMVISGVIYKPDGKTPAPGVILYVYHTNAVGAYPTVGDETGWGRRHGYLRGWMKTGKDGRYEFRTIRPGHYPGRNAAAHVHATVKEPDRREYWIDAFLFEGDPRLTEDEIHPREPRGGYGVIPLIRGKDGVWRGTRDIVLER